MQPEFFSAAFMSALFAIVLIDLVLAGDNALIIGLVARNLPRQTQRKVIFWGTFGAIAVRGLMAILVVYVLDWPGFMLAGAIALVWIARKLLRPIPRRPATMPLRCPPPRLPWRCAPSSWPMPSWASTMCWRSAAPPSAACC
jgi:predicted tellurium resistance membrane protein TerC